MAKSSMGSEKPLSNEDAARVIAYKNEVVSFFSERFKTESKRFPRWNGLLKRFKKAVIPVLAGNRAKFSGVYEAHNELCVADAILRCQQPLFTSLEYEPKLQNCTKSIDFFATVENGLHAFIDVKTIKPKYIDRWDQFEQLQQKGRFPENVQVLLSKEWLGGEIWHSAFAARGKMLKYTLELEQKIAECNLSASGAIFMMLFCGAGFYWHEAPIENFVYFYYTGNHRADDPFSKMEAEYICNKGIVIVKTISFFACMRRPLFTILPERLKWNVQPPPEPWK
ncbi:MAG: hypothetical protein KKE86_17005 [Planctomycetes bacterium]|nr:hypothetical protein [Planctomycetota bacterium]